MLLLWVHFRIIDTPNESHMLSAVRKHLPAKELLRRTIVDPYRTARRTMMLRRGIRAVRAGNISPEVLSSLRSTWGNEGFSADLRYLVQAAELASSTKGPILECGTGLTTLICGTIAESRGIELYCLEQDAAWLEEVRGALNGIRANLFYSPLKQDGEHVWYDVSALSLPAYFDLLICDGPFVSIDWAPDIYQSWRYGVLPALQRAGIRFGTLLLDDADEPRAPDVLKRWQREFGTCHSIVQSQSGDYAIVTNGAGASA